MKFFALALVGLCAVSAVAYSPNPVSVELGKYNQVITSGTALAGQNRVSLEVNIVSKASVEPIVAVQPQAGGSCSHVRTLVSFSGYDFKARKNVRTYEIQIDRTIGQKCILAIYGEASQSLEQAARISIF